MSIYKNGFTREKTMEIIRQNNKGYQAGYLGNCEYRTSDGNCCLVRCFIPEDRYNKSMEGLDSNAVLGSFSLESLMPLGSSLMRSLQWFHDEELTGLDGENFYNAIEQKLISLEKNHLTSAGK